MATFKKYDFVLGNSLWSNFYFTSLSPLYPLHEAPGFALSLILVFAIIVMLWRFGKGRNFWLWAIAYALLLVPGLASALSESVVFGDRFSFLPAMVLTLGLSVILRKIVSIPISPSLKWVRWGAIAALLGIIFWQSQVTFEYIPAWQNSKTLWSYGVAHAAGRSPKAYANLGVGFMEEQQYDEAKRVLEVALARDPKLVEAHNNLAICLINQNQLPLARAHLEAAIGLRPQYFEAINNLAYVERASAT